MRLWSCILPKGGTVDVDGGKIIKGGMILKKQTELRGIKRGLPLTIGAGATISEIIADSQINLHYRILLEAAKSLGSLQIRNMATIVGNLCNASPAADMAPPLLVLEAEVALQSSDKLRPRSTRRSASESKTCP